MNKAKEVFTVFEKNGNEALELIRSRSYLPSSSKILRTFGIKDASQMIGKSRQTIFDAELAKQIPKASKNEDSKRRMYTLTDINRIREHFKTRLEKPADSPPAKIAIANFKGGVCKTTTAVSFAQYSALLGYKVLFIDCDSQGSGTQYFGLIPDTEVNDDKTLLPYLIGKASSLKPSICETHWDGLDIIPANLSLYTAEFELPVKSINSTKDNNGQAFKFYSVLNEGLKEIEDNYDIIVFDTPPSMGMISINALFAANSLIVPLPPSMLDFSSTVQFFGMLKDVLGKLPAKEFSFIRLLITKYEKSENSQALITIIRQIFGEYVSMSMMPGSEAVRKADTEMKTIYEIDKFSGSKKTLDRARTAADEVNSEIIENIQKLWDVTSTKKEKEAAHAN